MEGPPPGIEVVAAAAQRTGCTVLVWGSWATGTADSTSDLDLLILGHQRRLAPAESMLRRAALEAGCPAVDVCAPRPGSALARATIASAYEANHLIAGYPLRSSMTQAASIDRCWRAHWTELTFWYSSMARSLTASLHAALRAVGASGEWRWARDLDAAAVRHAAAERLNVDAAALDFSSARQLLRCS